MKLSLNSVMLGEALCLADYIVLARKCGYEGVDFDINEVISLDPDNPVPAAQELFAAHSIGAGSWMLPVQWRQSDEELEAGLAQLPRQAEVASAIGGSRCCTWITGDTEQQPDQWRATIVPRLRRIAQILGEAGVRFGLEWLGPHCLSGDPSRNRFMWRMEQCLDLIDEIGESNVGLLVDSFHWFNSENTPGELEALSPEQIVYVHINDAPDRLLADQRDGEREVPGQGIIDLTSFLQALDKIGYRDYMAVEIFSDSLRQLPVEQCACEVREATAAVIKKALGSAE